MKCLLDPELNPDETALFHHIYRGAAQYLATRGKLPPLAFFRAGLRPRLPSLPPGRVAIVEMEMPHSDDGKDSMVEMLRQFARSADADMAVLLLESWMIKPTEEEAKQIQRMGQFLVRPSQHPHRIEIVFVSVSKPGGQNWSAWVEISRDPTGRPSIPATPPRLEYLQADGRFANILDGNGDQPSLS
jgi:hypothetical protein